jgi:hypothetical protein
MLGSRSGHPKPRLAELPVEASVPSGESRLRAWMRRASFGGMTVDRAIRWWPPVGLLAMLVLGWIVGRGPTPVDDWFARFARAVFGAYPRWLLVFTDWWLLGPVFAICVMAALYRRRWRLAVVMVVCSFAAIEITEACKRLFERHKGGALAYPSGHITLVVVVLGMVVLLAGGRLWAVTVAVAVGLLGMFGLVCTFHYFTDTTGAGLVGTAMVCVAARLTGGTAVILGSPIVDTAGRKD